MDHRLFELNIFFGIPQIHIISILAKFQHHFRTFKHTIFFCLTVGLKTIIFDHIKMVTKLLKMDKRRFDRCDKSCDRDFNWFLKICSDPQKSIKCEKILRSTLSKTCVYFFSLLLDIVLSE